MHLRDKLSFQSLFKINILSVFVRDNIEVANKDVKDKDVFEKCDMKQKAKDEFWKGHYFFILYYINLRIAFWICIFLDTHIAKQLLPYHIIQ